jgi:hypothetical protein
MTTLPTINWEHASWEEGCTAVEQFTDHLGATVDRGIFETVVALNLLGFRTYQSCDGHLDHGAFYPWVDVVDIERERAAMKEWINVCELEELAEATQTEEAYERYLAADTEMRCRSSRWECEDSLFSRLIGLLDAFYKPQTHQPGSSRLLIERFKTPGVYRLAPGFSQRDDTIPDHLKSAYLARGQMEMQAFTQYLKALWQRKQESKA